MDHKRVGEWQPNFDDRLSKKIRTPAFKGVLPQLD